MATIRAFSIALALAAFFFIGAPLQWLISRPFIARLAPAAADRIPIFFCRSLLWLLRIRVAVEGPRVMDRPVLIAANHVSWIDVLAFGSIMPFCFLAKSEVAAWPVLSAFAKVQGTVFINRARRRSILTANHQMAVRMSKGRSVLIFPEGTTHAMEPGPFRSSHFAAARDFLRRSSGPDVVEVQPVAIAYSSTAAAWVGEDALLPHIWRALHAPPIDCAISFAAPLDYRAGTDRKRIAVQSRDAIVRRLGVARSRAQPLTSTTGAVATQPVTGC